MTVSILNILKIRRSKGINNHPYVSKRNFKGGAKDTLLLQNPKENKFKKKMA